MAAHSSVLAWRIPGTGEPGGLPSLGSHRVGHDWGDLAAAAAAVQFSHSVMSYSLWPHGLQHTRPPCPSPTPGVYSRPLSRWCHPTSSSSVVPFSSCLQSFWASGSFPVSQFFALGDQKYWSFSFSISPSNEYSGLISFRMDSLDLPVVQGTLKSSPTPQFKSINSSVLSFLYSPTLTFIHDCWKNHSFD